MLMIDSAAFGRWRCCTSWLYSSLDCQARSGHLHGSVTIGDEGRCAGPGRCDGLSVDPRCYQDALSDVVGS
jgi:hypothetical protein